VARSSAAAAALAVVRAAAMVGALGLSTAGGAAARAAAPAGEAMKLKPHVPAVGNVAVIVLPTAGADRFSADYVAELVLAGAGSGGVYRPVPPEVLAEQLAKAGRAAPECAVDDECLRALAAALDLHHVMVATLSGAAAKSSLAPVVVTPGTLAVVRTPLDPIAGGDDAIIGAAPALGEKLSAVPPVGVVRLDGADGVTVTVDGVVVGTTPLGAPNKVLRLPAGAHDLKLERKGWASWSRHANLLGGKRYVLRWRS
jgi:hypothetical protein